MIYTVTAWCEEGPFRMQTDDLDAARDWAAYQEKKFGVKASVIEEESDET